MGSVKLSPRMISGKQKKHRRSNPPKNARRAMLHRMACSSKEIQMESKWPSNTGSHHLCTCGTCDTCGYLFNSIQAYSTHVGFYNCGIFMPSPQRPDNATRRTPGTLRMRPNKAKILLWRVLTSPRKQKPIKSPMKPGRLPMIGKAMAKPKLMLAWNHATCAIPQITPETNEGRTSWRGIWLCFLCVTT